MVRHHLVSQELPNRNSKNFKYKVGDKFKKICQPTKLRPIWEIIKTFTSREEQHTRRVKNRDLRLSKPKITYTKCYQLKIHYPDGYEEGMISKFNPEYAEGIVDKELIQI